MLIQIPTLSTYLWVILQHYSYMITYSNHVSPNILATMGPNNQAKTNSLGLQWLLSGFSVNANSMSWCAQVSNLGIFCCPAICCHRDFAQNWLVMCSDKDQSKSVHKVLTSISLFVTFFTLFYFYSIFFSLRLLNTLVARTHGYTCSIIATHSTPISDSFHSLSMTRVLLLDLTHTFMTQHLGIYTSRYQPCLVART